MRTRREVRLREFSIENNFSVDSGCMEAGFEPLRTLCRLVLILTGTLPHSDVAPATGLLRKGSPALKFFTLSSST
jgi:hypothetical protein